MTDADERLLIGRVARSHGNRGQVIVNPETDFAEQRFIAGQVLFVGRDAHLMPRRIDAVRFQQGRPIVGFEGIDTMDAAEALAGAEIWIARREIEPLPPGTYYHHDLVGCEVRDGADAVIGRVTAVEGPMEQSRLVVQGARGEILIPLVADICVQVDPSRGRIVVQPPGGLLELNERTGRVRDADRSSR